MCGERRRCVIRYKWHADCRVTRGWSVLHSLSYLFCCCCCSALTHINTHTSQVYEEECLPKTGFLSTPTSKTTFEQYVKLMFKWHSGLFRTLKGCLESEEWTLRRNALTVLNAILDVSLGCTA